MKLETNEYHAAERVNTGFVQHTVNLTADDLTSGVNTGQNQSESWTIDDGETIRLSFSNLSIVGSYYGNYLELSQNSTMTIDCSALMSQIQFTYYSSNYSNCTMTPNVGDYTHQNNSTTGTWTGSASNVIITVGNKNRNVLTGLQITYWTYNAS